MRIAVAAAAVLAIASMTTDFAPTAHANDSNLSFEFFYSNLSAHGAWLVSASYGRVWRPREYAPGWNPYHDGHWAYTDVGWVWVSDYTWGAIPYHYGTWTPDPALGWVWIPGYAWAPAWVVFRMGPDAIGWAPVAPRYSVGVSTGAVVPSSGSFVFVATRDFAAPQIRSRVIPDARARALVDRTTIVNGLELENHLVVNRGPDVRVVERARGRKIRSTPIESLSRVAPFASVDRARLAVAPGRIDRGVRAAEPVGAEHPLPATSERASTTRHGSPHAAGGGSPQSHETPRAARAQSSGGTFDRPETSKKPPARPAPKAKKKQDNKNDGGQGGSDE